VVDDVLVVVVWCWSWSGGRVVLVVVGG